MSRVLVNGGDAPDFLSTLDPDDDLLILKSLIIDIIGLSGFGLLTGGVYLQFGLAPALMFSGGLLLTGALLTAKGGKRVT
jgi:hypothetical protein